MNWTAITICTEVCMTICMCVGLWARTYKSE